MLAKQHGFYAEEPEKMWAIDSANDNFVDALVKIAPLVMGKKFDADGHKAYNAAVETIWYRKRALSLSYASATRASVLGIDSATSLAEANARKAMSNSTAMATPPARPTCQAAVLTTHAY